MPGVEQREVVKALLVRSGRDHVPIRRSFVQLLRRGGGGGPLAAFVKSRRIRALDLYLLAHAVVSASPYDVSLPAIVWARALGLAESPSSESAISKNWTWLEKQNLIKSGRYKRMREIRLLKEDGSGDEYRHPGRDGNYFKLPHAYWKGNFHNRMGLPAKAVLLIALSLKDDFILPTEHGAKWYGLSKDTVVKGLRVLRMFSILDMRTITIPAPLSKEGITTERRYSLRPPFVDSSRTDRD